MRWLRSLKERLRRTQTALSQASRSPARRLRSTVKFIERRPYADSQPSLEPWKTDRRGDFEPLPYRPPVYTVALLLDYLSTALGRLAAWIAGDDWP
jgi:hypothetical protein